MSDLDVDQPASCGRKVSFYRQTEYSYGTVKHTPTPTFHLLLVFDCLSTLNATITRDTHSRLVTLYPNGHAFIPEHQDYEHKIVPDSQIYIHQRVIFATSGTPSPLSKGPGISQPADDTARDLMTCNLTRSDISRSPSKGLSRNNISQKVGR